MKYQTVILDGHEISDYLAMSLMEHIGPAALLNNYVPVLQSILVNILTPIGYNEGTNLPLVELYQYGIDINTAEDLIAMITQYFHKVITPVFGNDLDKWFFNVSVTDAGEITITKIQKLEKPKELRPKPPLSEWTIRQSIDRGDYIPAQWRREVGL